MTRETKRALAFATHAFIDAHKKKDPYWFEGIVTPSGTVEVSFQSHLKSLVKHYGKSEQEVYKEMPVTASPLLWLMERTGCVPVYEQGYMLLPEMELTEEQRLVITILSRAGLTMDRPIYG